MGDVNGHSYLIHSLDDGKAEITDSVVAPLGASVTNQVAAVVRQQRHTLPELIETIDIVCCPKMLGVLQPQNNTDFAGALRSIDACCVVHAHEVLSVMRNKSIPQTEKPHYLVIRIWSGRSYSDVHHVDSGIFEALKIGGGKCLGIREPGRAFVAFEWRQHSNQRKRVKHVHYRTALNQINGAGGISGCVFCEELKPAAVEHWCSHCRCSNAEQAFQRLATCYHASDVLMICIQVKYGANVVSRGFRMAVSRASYIW